MASAMVSRLSPLACCTDELVTKDPVLILFIYVNVHLILQIFSLCIKKSNGWVLAYLTEAHHQ